jgi:uncharacterized protein (TIGR00375 family)
MGRTNCAVLHVHIGRTRDGRRIKITAARDLTIEGIAYECAARKGIEIVGIIDCACPPVLEELRQLETQGALVQLSQGGLRYKDRVTIIPGAEVETGENSGRPGHFLTYFPQLSELEDFSAFLGPHLSNPDLSTQRSGLRVQQVWQIVDSIGGFLAPAHSFTPYKSVYGSCARRLSELFDDRALSRIPALELGLSADSDMADCLSELSQLTFLSDSDAHSLPRIGREYNIFQIESPTYEEVLLALRRKHGRRVAANFGLDPRLGKYHRTFCLKCSSIARAPPPVHACPLCGGDKVVMGVLDRLVEIRDYEEPKRPAHRPPYRYQVPLNFIPGLGAVGMSKLLNRFGTEMAVLHEAGEGELSAVVGGPLARTIIAAREGKLPVQPGGGGKYGKPLTTAAETQLAFEVLARGGERQRMCSGSEI